MSFRPSVWAARCSRVLTSILCLIAVIVAGTVLVPMRSRYERPGHQRLVVHPDQMRGELIGDLGPRVGLDQDVAARDVDLVGEREGDGIAGLAPRPASRHRSRCRATRELWPEAATTTGSPVLDRARTRRFRHSRGNRRFGRLTHCTGKRNGLAAVVALDVDGLEIVEQRRAVVPGRVARQLR